MTDQKKAVVSGAGLVGCLWSVFLAQRGYQVDIYERRGDMRDSTFEGGRSINLAMSTRGWKAMEKAGIRTKIESVAIPMTGRMMHAVDGELTYQAYGEEGQAIYSVSRGGLNRELMNIADESPNVQLHFNQRCRGFDKRTLDLHIEDTKTKERRMIQSPLVFAADGAFSGIRESMRRTDRFNYAQQYLPHGYKELHIPPNPDGTHQIDKNALHIWPRGHFMMIALPNQDGSFTCTLFLPYEGKQSFENLQTDEQVIDFFETYFKDSIPLMPDLLEDFKANKTSSLVTIRCNPWQYKKQILLMGDASHAIVPFYGQGMNSGFEDCTLLDALATKHNEDWSKTIQEFSDTRIKDANAIADLALRNFTEMSDKVGDPMFLLRKKIEKYLHEKYPTDFLPVYSMVTFSHIPYSEALAETKRQDALFDKILAIPNIEEQWNNGVVDQVFEVWKNK